MTDTVSETGGVGSGRPRWGARRVEELLFAGFVLALGVFALAGVLTIRVPVGSRVGPTVFPAVVAVLMLVSAGAVLVGVLRGRLGAAEESEDVDADRSTDWATLGKIVGLIAAHLLLIDLIGWAPAAALLFGGVAWSLGAKRWWFALIVGAVLAGAIQVLFGTVLGLSLPLGPLLGGLAL